MLKSSFNSNVVWLIRILAPDMMSLWFAPDLSNPRISAILVGCCQLQGCVVAAWAAEAGRQFFKEFRRMSVGPAAHQAGDIVDETGHDLGLR